MTKRQYSILRDRIVNYRARVRRVNIDERSPAKVIDTPVDVGIDGVINPSEISSLEDIPYLRPRTRDFAFNYATCTKTYKQWAEDYGVSYNTIIKWTKDPGVQAVVSLVRYQRRMWKFVMSQRIENAAYNGLMDVLQARRTSENLPTIQRAVEYVMGIVSGTGGTNSPHLMGGAPEDATGNPYRKAEASERDVTKLRQDIADLDAMYEDIVEASGGE